MASHLSSIGFPVQTEHELYSLAEQIAQIATPLEVAQGYYLSFQDPSGATIWLHADKHRQISGMNPHFVGPSVIKVKMVRAVHNDQGHGFDGAFYVWADPENDHGNQDGAYPFVFDVPDYLQHSQQNFPLIQTVQIAAFAHNIEIFANEADFHKASGTGLPMAAEAFVPAGLQTTEESGPTAHALINGRVLDTQKRTNQFTGKSFWWLQVQSFGGVFDVVADPTLLRTDPRPGCIVKGSFWLSGMIVNDAAEDKARTGFLRLLHKQS